MPLLSRCWLRRLLLLVLVAGAAVLAYGLYLWNLPHRDVVALAPDHQGAVQEFITEYLNDPAAANQRYLSDDGKSTVVALRGTIRELRTNAEDLPVAVLGTPGQPAAIAFTFDPSRSGDARQLSPGDIVTLKGVVRAGPEHNEVLGLWTDGVIEKASLPSD